MYIRKEEGLCSKSPSSSFIEIFQSPTKAVLIVLNVS